MEALRQIHHLCQLDLLEQILERLVLSRPRQRLFLREIWGISAQIRLPIWDQMISRVSSLIKCVSWIQLTHLIRLETLEII